MEPNDNEDLIKFGKKFGAILTGTDGQNLSGFQRYIFLRNFFFQLFFSNPKNKLPDDTWGKAQFLTDIFGIRKEIIENFMVTQALYSSEDKDRDRLIHIVDKNIRIKPNHHIFQNFRKILAGYFVYVLASPYGVKTPCSARSAQKLAATSLNMAESTAKQYYSKISERIIEPNNQSLRMLLDACLFMGVSSFGKDRENLEMCAPIHKSALSAYDQALETYQNYINECTQKYRQMFIDRIFNYGEIPETFQKHPIFSELLRDHDEHTDYEEAVCALLVSTLCMHELMPDIITPESILLIYEQN
jgi:tetratricopeptide (TPR) repeat protein